MIMNIKDTKERAEFIFQLNKVGDYNTHKELWDAYYKLEEELLPIDSLVRFSECKCEKECKHLDCSVIKCKQGNKK